MSLTAPFVSIGSIKMTGLSRLLLETVLLRSGGCLTPSSGIMLTATKTLLTWAPAKLELVISSLVLSGSVERFGCPGRERPCQSKQPLRSSCQQRRKELLRKSSGPVIFAATASMCWLTRLLTGMLVANTWWTPADLAGVKL